MEIENSQNPSKQSFDANQLDGLKPYTDKDAEITQEKVLFIKGKSREEDIKKELLEFDKQS